MLHTVHKSPFEADDLEACLRLAGRGDDIILYENAVIAALVDGDWAGRLSMLAESGVKVCVLQPDLVARGFPVRRLVKDVNTIDYDGFVTLVERHATTQAW